MYVDSHCHLTAPELLGRIDAIRAAMRAAAVDRALCICTTLEDFPAVHALATAHGEFWASAGVHPDTEASTEPTLDGLIALAALPRVVAIGETGLDYFRLAGRSVADMEWQRERFRVHIRAARETGKPLIIHTRAAATDTLRIMQEEGAEVAGGVMHCFTESWEVAQQAMDMGFYISFSGIVTFKKALALKEVAKRIPLDRMLIETDSPYLAPSPYRGKTNEPAWVKHVAEEIAGLRSVSVDEIGHATSINYFKLFKHAIE